MSQQSLMPEPSMGGQYLTFVSGGELFAVDIMAVSEIIEVAAITRVPKAPVFIRGVINLRGGVVPVIDLVAKLNNGQSEFSRRSCVVLVNIVQDGQEQILGLLVDEVREIVDVEPEAIKPPPELGDDADTGFIQAMAQLSDQFIILLDVSQVLSHHEISQASDIASLTPENNSEHS